MIVSTQVYLFQMVGNTKVRVKGACLYTYIFPTSLKNQNPTYVCKWILGFIFREILFDTSFLKCNIFHLKKKYALSAKLRSKCKSPGFMLEIQYLHMAAVVCEHEFNGILIAAMLTFEMFSNLIIRTTNKQKCNHIVAHS